MSMEASSLAGQPHTVDVAALIDRSRLGASQIAMLLLCGLCLIMDGFDVQAMGYVAPALIAEWSIPRAALGPVFGAGLFGMLVGSLALSVVADRFGRRPVLIGATLFFAACMLATPQAGTVRELTILRFITGLGLGGIMPNAMALAGEYSPRRVRVTVMMVISCGFTVGAVLGGLVSVALIESYGWRAVFYFGGAVPVILALLMIFFLPESLQLLVLRGKNQAMVHRWLRRTDPSISLTGNTSLIVQDGTSEEIVGRAVRDFARREEVVLATKVFNRMRPGSNGMGLSRKAIMAEIDASVTLPLTTRISSFFTTAAVNVENGISEAGGIAINSRTFFA